MGTRLYACIFFKWWNMHRSVPFSACLGNHTKRIRGMGMGKETFPSNPIGSTNNSQSGIGIQVRPYLSSTCTYKKARNLSISHITYHISHITVLNLNLDLETSPITPHHIKAARTERRRIKMEIFNVERVRPTYLHTPYIPTYLPTFLLHLFTFRLPSFHFISHSHVPFYVLCFMFHVSCCMSFLFHFLFYIDR